MSSTEKILEAAKKLGGMIGEHEAAKKLEAATTKLQNDSEAQRTLNDYNRHLRMVAEKESQNQPIEVEDKHKLEELQNAVIHNALLRELQIAQMDFVDLMRRVDEAMQGPAATTVLPPEAAPQTATSPLTNPDLSDLSKLGGTR